MSKTTTDKYSDGDYQKAVAEMADKHIIYNISALIYELLPHAGVFEHLTEHKIERACGYPDEHENEEIFEHWLISEWLSRKLEEKGEKIIHDLFNLTIWCRTCTGQSIHMDHVICYIYDSI